MLRVRDLGVSYGDTVAVRDIDLDLTTGETLALLGRSGSGKTTVLRAIAGLVPLDRGSVEIDGRNVIGVPTHRRGVGLVFQDFALFPHLDVAANVAYGLQASGSSGVADRVAEALALVGLSGLKGRRIDQLSGGQAQRVALARTLVTEPGLLLLDEPLGSLDPDLRGEVARELEELLHRTGIPTIVVTHDTAEAFALGDRVAVLVDGEVAVEGSPEQVWADPKTAEAARLLGHRSLVDTVVSNGTTALGGESVVVVAPDGPAALLLLPGSITTPGAIEAAITSIRYRGPDWLATVALDHGPIEVPIAERVEPGTRIGIAIDPTGVVALRP